MTGSTTAPGDTSEPDSPDREPPRPGLIGIWSLDLAYILFGLLPTSLYALYNMTVKRKYRQSWWGKWGFGLTHALRDVPAGAVWVHAVSVGEARAAVPVVAELRRRFPGFPVVVTTTTATGHRTACKLLADCVVWWFPYDLSFVVARWFRRLRPRLVVLMEGDLWPNFARVAARRGVPLALINGKLSDRSSRRYQRLLHSPLAPLIRAMWSPLGAVCVQTELDRERIAPFVGDLSRLHVTGNVKFDFPALKVTADQRHEWCARLGLREQERVIVAGSTHATEEALLVAALAEVRSEHPDTHLILVPRHPERFNEVVGELEKTPFHVQRWSQARGDGADITVVDEMGLLQGLYSLATVAVVGGSYVKVGGHNVLEPALFGIPVIFGPHMHAQRGMRKVLLSANGGLQVSREELPAVLTRLLGDPDERERLGFAGQEAVRHNQGSAERSVGIVSMLIH